MASYTTQILLVWTFINLIMIREANLSPLESLKSLRKDQRNGSSDWLSQFKGEIVQCLAGRTFKKGMTRFESISKDVADDPCTLIQIASYFGKNDMRLIVSKKHINMADIIKSCKERFSLSIRASHVYIEGDENDIKALQSNAQEFLTRDFQCFAVLCSDICSRFMLQIANRLGFGVGIYLWITQSVADPSKESNYPSKLISLMPRQEIDSHMPRPKCFQVHNISSADTVFSQYVYCREQSVIGKDKRSPRKRVCSSLNSKNFFGHIPAWTKKPMLRAAMVTSLASKSYPNLLDTNDMSCQHGLLCWTFPFKNGSFATEREPSCCIGFIPDILSKLKEDLQINFYLYEVATWNGLIGDVLSGKADVATDLLTMSKARLSVVDFTESFLEDDIVIASKIQVSQLPYLNFNAFAGLSLYSWISIISLTFISAVIIYWSERIMLCSSKSNSLVWILQYAIGLLFQRDIGGLLPIKLGSQVISIALAIALMIFMTSYTAVLTTRNITNKKKLPISGMDDPKLTQPTLNFQVATYKDSVISQMFEQSKKDSWRRLGEFMKPHNFRRFADAHKKMRNGELDALIVNKIAMMWGWKGNVNCNIKVAEVIRKGAMGFAVQKGSPWNEPISHFLRKYKSNHVLGNIQRNHLASECKNQIKNDSTQFGILYLSGAVIMLGAGVILSGISFILEHVFNLYSRKSIVKRRESLS